MVIGFAIEVHSAMGPGPLKSAYEECLCYELAQSSTRFSRQLALPAKYKGVKLDFGYRMDLIINSIVPVLKQGIKRVVNHFTGSSASLRLCGEDLV